MALLVAGFLPEKVHAAPPPALESLDGPDIHRAGVAAHGDASAEQLEGRAIAAADPLLLLDAAEAYLLRDGQGGRERAVSCVERALLWSDAAKQQAGDGGKEDVNDPGDRDAIRKRADAILNATDRLQDRSDVAGSQASTESRRSTLSNRPGEALILSGSIVGATGIVGLGAGCVALALGSRLETNARTDVPLMPALAGSYDTLGRAYNIQATVGLVAGGAALIVGAALLGAGVKRKRRRSIRVSPTLSDTGRGGAGFQILGRFR